MATLGMLSETLRNEKENYWRMLLLLERATDVLQDVLGTQLQVAYPRLFDPSKTDKLFDVLDNQQVKYSLLSLRKRHGLNSFQMELLYPSGTPSTTVTTQDLDITLTVVLLRNITNLNPRAKWEIPPASDTSIEANIGRVKTYRNQLSCVYRAGITNTAFQAAFNDLKHVLLSLSSKYSSADYDMLCTVPLDIKGEFGEQVRRLCVSGKITVYRQRVVIVGPSGAGKTHLARRLLQEKYDNEKDALTPGVEIHRHACIVDKSSWIKETEHVPENQFVRHMASAMQKPETYRQLDQMGQPPSAEFTQEAESASPPVDSEPHPPSDKTTAAVRYKNIDPRLLKKMEKMTRGEPVDPEKRITIWDFGGQDVYYTTHQTFLSQQVIYLLVFRLDKWHKGKIPMYGGERTVKEFVMFWLNSIHMHTVGKLEKKDKTITPYVLIIGTHKDKLHKKKFKSQVVKIFRELEECLNEKPLLKSHVFDYYGISNLAGNEEFYEIRSAIEYLSGFTSYGETTVPVNWIQLELDLAEKSKEKPLIDIKELREMASLVGIPDAELDEMFVPYHHRLGDVLHFKVDGLENVVILNPQWLADLFSAIITPPVSEPAMMATANTDPEGTHFDNLKADLRRGTLKEEVFDRYLQRIKMAEIKPVVIRLMLHFDLMFDISDSVEFPLSNLGTRTYLVPSMLKPNASANPASSERDSKKFLLISYPHIFFPHGLFHRLIIRLLGTYDAQNYVHKIPVVGFDSASFRLKDEQSILHLVIEENAMKLLIKKEKATASPPQPWVYSNARETVQRELSDLQTAYCPGMNFRYFIRVKNDKKCQNVLVDSQTVQTNDVINRVVGKSDKRIDLTPYRVWFSGEGAVENVPQVPQKRPSESKLGIRERERDYLANKSNFSPAKSAEKEQDLSESLPLETASFQTPSTSMEEKVKVRPCSLDRFQKEAFDDENVYKNYTKLRGRAVIINNVSFDNDYYPDREGTEVDVERLERLFQQLNYLVLTHDNMTVGAINQLAELEARTDHSAYSSFIMVILSHGGENTVIGTNGFQIGYDQILAHFEASKCPALKGKPKMFFISACQIPSEREDKSASDVKTKPKQMTTKPQNTSSNTEDGEIAEKADMILVTSTTTGDKSWRSPTHGTWFIQCLVRELLERACDTHLSDILTKVIKSVSQMTTQDGCRQVPEKTRDRLTKALYFWPGFYVKDGETKQYPE